MPEDRKGNIKINQIKTNFLCFLHTLKSTETHSTLRSLMIHIPEIYREIFVFSLLSCFLCVSVSSDCSTLYARLEECVSVSVCSTTCTRLEECQDLSQDLKDEGDLPVDHRLSVCLCPPVLLSSKWTSLFLTKTLKGKDTRERTRLPDLCNRDQTVHRHCHTNRGSVCVTQCDDEHPSGTTSSFYVQFLFTTYILRS